MLRTASRLDGFANRPWCRTRVSLPRHTPCSAHPCQCRMQVKHGSCAAYENASYRLTKSVGGVSASLSSGMFGVAISVVSQSLSALFRPAFTEGGYPALLPPAGIKPDTALATAHQRRRINKPGSAKDRSIQSVVVGLLPPVGLVGAASVGRTHNLPITSRPLYHLELLQHDTGISAGGETIYGTTWQRWFHVPE